MFLNGTRNLFEKEEHMEYTIRRNEEYGSNEIYFDDKPEKSVRDSIKAMGMKWNGNKGCWYGFVDKSRICETLGDPMAFYSEASEGYMGATSYRGNNVNKFDYSSDCFRKAFRAAGINGVSVRKKTYSGGMSFYFTVDMDSDDYVSYEDFGPSSYGYWYNYIDEYGEHRSIHRDILWSDHVSPELREKIIEDDRKFEYDYLTRNHADIYNNNRALSEKGKSKVSAIASIVQSFNYDDSNSQVDYYETNFYWDMVAKRA